MRKDIEILMKDGCTENEAKKHLLMGTNVIELEDFFENIDDYLYGCDDDEKEEIKKELKENGYTNDLKIIDNYIIMYCL